MRPKSIVLLLLALGCGLVASISITKVMANRNAAPAPLAAESESIFVAMTDIPMGDPITPEVVKLEDWPKGKVPAGALTKLEDIEGRRPKTKIVSGSPILDNWLLSKGASDQGATGLIPKGYRVVSVKVDAVSSGASLIRPGDRVDVLVHLEKCLAKNIPETCTRTFLQDIKVFAVNDVFALDTGDEGDKSQKAQTVSLLVTPEQAEKVMLATELGRIRLVMRSPEDDEQTTVAGASAQKLFGIADGGDRGSESLLDSSAMKPALSGDATDFLQLLGAQKSQAAPQSQVAMPASADIWSMRILAGSEVNDTVLEAPLGDSLAEDRSTIVKWKVGGVPAAGLVPTAEPDLPAVSSGEQPGAPAGDEQQEAEPAATDEQAGNRDE